MKFKNLLDDVDARKLEDAVFDPKLKLTHGPLIEKYGMKYPALQTFSGLKA